MGLTHSPKIVRDGLVLHLDAANVKSYSGGTGGGTPVKDISGNGYDGTFSGSPDFITDNLGGFETNGTENEYISVPDNENIRTGTNPWSFQIVFKIKSISLTYPGIIRKGSSGSGGVGFQIFYVSSGLSYFKHYNSQDDITTWTAGETQVLTVINNGSNVKSYKNGELYTNSWLSMGYTDTSEPFRIGMGDSRGNNVVNSFMLYNRALSEEEVVKNFNAIKDRFGL